MYYLLCHPHKSRDFELYKSVIVFYKDEQPKINKTGRILTTDGQRLSRIA